MATRKKFVLVGTGGRSEMFWKAIAEDHKDNCELLAICDINPGRLEQRRKDIAELGWRLRPTWRQNLTA